MKRHQGSTMFLMAVLFLIGILALAFCLFVLPGMASRDAAANPETAYLQYPFLVCAYLLFLPFFAVLYQTFKLLSYIDRSQAFSKLSVCALKNIKYCAITISLLFVGGLGLLILFIEGNITGVIMMCFICIFASSVISSFAAILQKLLKDAIDIKSENDFTV